jgi:hypothetical protein
MTTLIAGRKRIASFESEEIFVANQVSPLRAQRPIKRPEPVGRALTSAVGLPLRAASPTRMNWALVSAASAVTVLILAGLGVAVHAVVDSPASERKIAPEALAIALKADPAAKRLNSAVIAKSAVPRRERSTAFEEHRPTAPTIPPLSTPIAAAPPVAPTPFNEVPKTEPTCQRYGTSVKFLSSTADAAALAAREQKLQFVLHISGNFEDSRFT